MYLSAESVASHELPLQDCFVSFSSAGDVLALAQNTKMIILICKYNNKGAKDNQENIC